MTNNNDFVKNRKYLFFGITFFAEKRKRYFSLQSVVFGKLIFRILIFPAQKTNAD